MARSFATVVFSHGKESGPWGSKITALAAVARDLGLQVESVDYRGIDDPRVRVEKLLALGRSCAQPLVLVGSSLGGHVAAAAAATGHLKTRALFLMDRTWLERRHRTGREQHPLGRRAPRTAAHPRFRSSSGGSDRYDRTIVQGFSGILGMSARPLTA
jgi:pimeloyl-ACP methyl ester carboxylesterase